MSHRRTGLHKWRRRCTGLPRAKTVLFRPVVTKMYKTLIGNSVLEVEPTSQHGPLTTGNGQNGFDLENFMLLEDR